MRPKLEMSGRRIQWPMLLCQPTHLYLLSLRSLTLHSQVSLVISGSNNAACKSWGIWKTLPSGLCICISKMHESLTHFYVQNNISLIIIVLWKLQDFLASFKNISRSRSASSRGLPSLGAPRAHAWLDICNCWLGFGSNL